jgi:hypothetical protein
MARRRGDPGRAACIATLWQTKPRLRVQSVDCGPPIGWPDDVAPELPRPACGRLDPSWAPDFAEAFQELVSFLVGSFLDGVLDDYLESPGPTFVSEFGLLVMSSLEVRNSTLQ